eukprot:2690781-Rhodomonas_salina.1
MEARPWALTRQFWLVQGQPGGLLRRSNLARTSQHAVPVWRRLNHRQLCHPERGWDQGLGRRVHRPRHRRALLQQPSAVGGRCDRRHRGVHGVGRGRGACGKRGSERRSHLRRGCIQGGAGGWDCAAGQRGG